MGAFDSVHAPKTIYTGIVNGPPISLLRGDRRGEIILSEGRFVAARGNGDLNIHLIQ